MRAQVVNRKVPCLAVACIVAWTLSVGVAQEQQSRQKDQQSQQKNQQNQSQNQQNAQRNKHLEGKVFRALNEQGLRQDGQVLALALGNEVILLGRVPQGQIAKAEEVVKKVESVKKVDNRLKASGAQEMPEEMRLAQSIRQKVQEKMPETAPNLNVRMMQGAIVLRGNVDTWRQMADIVETAFAAGAPRVATRMRVTQEDMGRQPTFRQGARVSEQQKAADQQLTSKIQKQLQQETSGQQTVRVIDPEAVYVVIDGANVALFGPVKNEDQKHQIEQAVRSVEGVQNVDNVLAVGGQAPKKSSQSQKQASEAMKAREQMNESERKLARKIEQQFQQELSDTDLQVSVTGKTATLRGSVQQNQTKEKAAEVAKNVEGVEEIQNQIRVQQGQQGRQGQQAQVSERQLSRQIQQQIDEKVGEQLTVRVIEPNGVYVATSQGRVVLFGSVDSKEQKQKLTETVQSIEGVENVESLVAVDMERQRQQAQGEMTGSERSVAERVEQQLLDQFQGEGGILVVVNDGTATLRGTVASEQQREKVSQIARDVQGVENVQNELDVAEDQGFYAIYGYIYPTYEEGRAAEEQGQQPMREGGQPQQQPMREGQRQQERTREVQAEQDEGLPSREQRLELLGGRQDCVRRFEELLTTERRQNIAQNVFATCRAGRMELFGFVRTEGESAILETVATKVRGITEVENHLDVRPEGWEPESDADIREDVESEMFWSPFVDLGRIEVSVQNGVVTLTGLVDNWDAALHVFENTFEGGARGIINRLRYEELEN